MADTSPGPLLQRFLEKVSKIPEAQEMLAYLRERKSMPAVSQVDLPPGVLGMFEGGKSRKIKLSPQADTGTFIHELIHAVDYAMIDQYMENTSPFYKEAFEKLKFDPKTPKGQSAFRSDAILQSMAPEYHSSIDSYRKDPAEAIAFSVQKHLQSNSKINSPAPSHIDATMATEFFILLDAARKANTGTK